MYHSSSNRIVQLPLFFHTFSLKKQVMHIGPQRIES
uniref:Uncharacterized protein n=1 Tax=Anguilla anguilla TaxID=7936 RepID=A0A0E9T2H0_ANGAN